MKKKHILIGMVLGMFSVTGFAGMVNPVEVNVDLDNMIASGDMLTARNAEGEDVLIGCGQRIIDLGNDTVFAWGFCQATDADGDQKTCITENAELLNGIDSISDTSYITFAWDLDDNCTRIGSSTQSFYAPKGKANKAPKVDD